MNTSAAIELTIPDLGDGVEQGVVITLLVAAGEAVAEGQALLEIETDKVTLEIPAPRAGVVTEFLVAENAVIRPGDAVLRLSAAADDTAVAAPQTPPVETTADKPIASAERDKGAMAPAPPPAITTMVPAGPAARREARQLGVDLARVSGSGPRGRILVADVRAWVRTRLHAELSAPVSEALPDLARFGAVRREKMSGLERATARNMSRAARLVPQAWVTREIDITAVEAARRAARAAAAPDTAPLTMTAVLCRCLADAMRAFPRFNAAFDEAAQELVYRDYVHVGVAVDTERGLLVPVVRDADRLTITTVAAELTRLSGAARDSSLTASELRGAGMTLSNLGGLGASIIQPLVNWPEVAIIGVGASAERVVMGTAGPQSRHYLPLTLGFDHRVINGADAARLLGHLAELLADERAFANWL